MSLQSFSAYILQISNITIYNDIYINCVDNDLHTTLHYRNLMQEQIARPTIHWQRNKIQYFRSSASSCLNQHLGKTCFESAVAAKPLRQP